MPINANKLVRLVVYYLQVGREEPLLPPMESFKAMKTVRPRPVEAISKLLPERRSASRKDASWVHSRSEGLDHIILRIYIIHDIYMIYI